MDFMIKILEFANAPGANTISDTFPVDTLDAWYEKERYDLIGKTIWMKMDVEAAELEVVKGGQNFIQECHPIILNENHTCHKPGIDIEFKELMKNMFNYEEIKKMDMESRFHSIFKYKIKGKNERY